MKSVLRKTKIICTIGPVSSSPQIIKQLIKAGMNVARLNFSYGDNESHKKTINMIKKASKESGVKVEILQDLGGPKIRLGVLYRDNKILNDDEMVILCVEETSDFEKIPVNYPYLLEDVNVGEKIILSDGLVELVVQRKDNEKLFCKVTKRN